MSNVARDQEPDPTALTQEMADRLEVNISRIFDGKIDGLKELVKYVITHVDKLPGLIKQEVATLESLSDEKFKGIDGRFATGETALRAALQASKELGDERDRSKAEAIAKSDANTTKLIEAQAKLIQTIVESTDTKIGALKEQIGVVNSMRLGSREQTQDTRTAVGTYIGIAGFALAALLGVVTVMNSMNRQQAPVYVPVPSPTPPILK